MDPDALLAGLRNRKLRSTKPPTPVPSRPLTPIESIPIIESNRESFPNIDSMNDEKDTKLTLSDLETNKNSMSVVEGEKNTSPTEDLQHGESNPNAIVELDKNVDFPDSITNDSKIVESPLLTPEVEECCVVNKVDPDMCSLDNSTILSEDNCNSDLFHDQGLERGTDSECDSDAESQLFLLNPVATCRPLDIGHATYSTTQSNPDADASTPLNKKKNEKWSSSLQNHPIVREIKHLRSIGAVHDCDMIHGNSRYSLKYLSAAGYDVTTLHKYGKFTAYAMKNEGMFSAAELLASGCYMLTELKRAGYTAMDIRPSGIHAKLLLNAGYSVNDLLVGGFSIHELRVGCQVQARVLKELNIPVSVLIENGYTGSDMYRAGCNASELLGFHGRHVIIDDVDSVNGNNHVNSTTAPSNNMEYSYGIIERTRENAKYLKSCGYNAQQIKEAGYGVRELKYAGFTFPQVSTLGFLDIDLHDGGFHEEIERQVLTELYECTNGRDWTIQINWCLSPRVSEWYGVTVEPFSQRVTELNLSNNNLTGYIPKSIVLLTHLQVLVLDSNQIQLQSLNNSSNVNITTSGNTAKFGVNNNATSAKINISGVKLQSQSSWKSKFTCSSAQPVPKYGPFASSTGSSSSSLPTTPRKPNPLSSSKKPKVPNICDSIKLFEFKSLNYINLAHNKHTRLNSNVIRSYNRRDTCEYANSNANTGAFFEVELNGASEIKQFLYSTRLHHMKQNECFEMKNSIGNNQNMHSNIEGKPAGTGEYVSTEEELLQKEALICLYYSTNGHKWKKNTNWCRMDVPLSSWYGVTTTKPALNAGTKMNLNQSRSPYNNSTANTNSPMSLTSSIHSVSAAAPIYITKLNLAYNNLNGCIPNDFYAVSEFNSLRCLDLRYNQLHGGISNNIINLQDSLSELYLHCNKLTGSNLMEWCPRMRNLTKIDLSSNSLSGNLTKQDLNLLHCNLKRLDVFHISSNVIELKCDLRTKKQKQEYVKRLLPGCCSVSV